MEWTNLFANKAAFIHHSYISKTEKTRYKLTRIIRIIFIYEKVGLQRIHPKK